MPVPAAVTAGERGLDRRCIAASPAPAAICRRRSLTNADLAQRIDTDDEWMRTRTGIRQRHIAAAGEQTSDLALAASRAALAAAGIDAADIDLIIVATTTPDMVFPSTACILQHKLGTKNGAGFDVQAVCSGFVYALSIADRMVAAARAQECAGRRRRNLFAHPRLERPRHLRAVRRRRRRGRARAVGTPGILAAHLHADGSYRDILSVPGTVAQRRSRGRPFLHMDGHAVFKFAVKVLAEAAQEALAAAGMAPGAVDWLIPHQANIRIMEATAKKLGLPLERMISTVGRHANTSAASIPLALDVAVRDGRIQPGHNVMLLGVGGGFTWGSILLRWTDTPSLAQCRPSGQR